MSRFDNSATELLHFDGEFATFRAKKSDETATWLIVTPDRERPIVARVAKLRSAYDLRGELDAAWAAVPVELTEFRGQPALIVQDPGGEFLDKLLGTRLSILECLRLATGMARALAGLHGRRLVHKDVKPKHFLVDMETGNAWLTGFGLASRQPRHRHAGETSSQEVVGGTFAYMAPEQTGRVNRSIDSRTDFYAFGITLYEMLTGSLPFDAADPMEWVHCHLAREPIQPNARCQEIPECLSAIVMKLLSKTPEARYQTAAGVEADLRRCLASFEGTGPTEAFLPGLLDVPDQLLIPERLYGRRDEVATLHAAFDRASRLGTREMVLVSGYAGVGKTSIVHELQKSLGPSRGLFASGRFDQYQRDIPYATITQAFRKLILYILSRNEAEITQWRESLSSALGQSGQLIMNLIPELELIVGKQPHVVELPPQEEQSRFRMVFQSFLGVFATESHPFVLFLDNLQWIDDATARLLTCLMTDAEVRNLVVVGAYRDNEVGEDHLMMQVQHDIREAGLEIQHVKLMPLSLDQVARFVGDCLHCDTEHARPLAQLIDEKAGGNPFFIQQFVTMLAEDGLLTFNSESAAWVWDLPGIRARKFSENVVDLMADKLDRLPAKTQQALSLVACLGSAADIARLVLVSGESQEFLDEALQPALDAGFISRSDAVFTFLHDRLQEVAHRSIPADERAALHLRIGRSLAGQTAENDLEERIFEIVSHFNHAGPLRLEQPECDRVAGLYLLAGKRAKATGAYGSAHAYLATGSQLLLLLSDGGQDRSHSLSFDLELHRAECEILIGEPATAEARLNTLARIAQSNREGAAVACMQVDLYTNLDRAGQALETGLAFLRRAGIAWSAHPTDQEVSEEFHRIWQNLGSRAVDKILELPAMRDPDCCAILDVLLSLQGPAHFTDGNLVSLVVGRMTNLSLEHGNSASSCFAYVYLGAILESRFGDYRRGLRFGQVGVELSDKPGLERFRARVYNNFGATISPWASHARNSIEMLRRANQAAREAGDLTFMAYSYTNIISALLITGDPLEEVQKEAEAALLFMRRTHFGTVAGMVSSQLGMVRALRGLTHDLSTFNDSEFDEPAFVAHFEKEPGMEMSACWYWIRKMQGSYLAGALETAISAEGKAERLLWTATNFIVMADFHFYGALLRLAQHEQASPAERPAIWEKVERHRKTLAAWVENCPETFANRGVLVEAEIARISGRPLEAMDLYEKAIQSAREHGFIQNEALASELAGKFHMDRGFATIADAYLQAARHAYLRWGAVGKLRQLDASYPHLRGQSVPPAATATATIRTNLEQLDLISIVKISQAVSGEIVLSKLIKKLLKIVVEHAGAERGLFILLRDSVPRIEAEAATSRSNVEVTMRPRAATSSELPESILHFVIRTREAVVIDDASAGNAYAADEYFLRTASKSVLCLPIVTQTQPIGVLYLENKLTPYAFTSDLVGVLELVGAQAAISLENARLYEELERENLERKQAENALRSSAQNLRNIVNTIPTMVWSAHPDGSCDFFNQRWLDYTGFTMEQALGWGWTSAFHPDDVKEDVLAYWQNCLTTGTPVNTELRMRRYDGVYRMFLLLGAPLRDETGLIRGWYGTNIDIEDRKLAEERLRRSEAFLAEGQRVSLTGSFSWNLDRDTIAFSEECCRIFGFAPDQPVLMEKIAERIHPEDLPILAQRNQEAKTLQLDHDYEIRLIMPDGDIKYLYTMSHAVRNREGELEYIGTIQDITQRHLTEQNIRKSELHLRQMTETIPEMLWSATADGAIDYCNGRLLSYTGFNAEEVMGGGWIKLIHPDDVPQAAREWLDCVSTGRQYVVDVRTFHASDSTYRWCTTSALPLHDSHGRIQKWYGTVVDMHDRKRADEELRSSELRLREVQNELAHVTRVTTMGELAASIAHEINQPIAGVVINANTSLRWLSRVKEDSVNIREARETIDRIVRDGVRAGDIIARIRALFKKTEPAKEQLNLNETIREIIVLARNEIDKSQVKLRLELAGDLPDVLGDRVQLQQVTLNLILNAIDAMSSVSLEARNLMISTQRHDEKMVVVTVRDSGVGLSAGSADVIFTAFHTTKTGGLGMGLAISRSIIENHLGKLWVTQHEGPGASFQFTLPVASSR